MSHCSPSSLPGFDSFQDPKSIAFHTGEDRRRAAEQTLKVVVAARRWRSPSGSRTTEVSGRLGGRGIARFGVRVGGGKRHRVSDGLQKYQPSRIILLCGF
jgi:hypothetical protein